VEYKARIFIHKAVTNSTSLETEVKGSMIPHTTCIFHGRMSHNLGCPDLQQECFNQPKKKDDLQTANRTALGKMVARNATLADLVLLKGAIGNQIAQVTATTANSAGIRSRTHVAFS
jgi:hypothetical protein